MPESLSQILAVFSIEIRKTFFARRGLSVYVLAFAPVLLFGANSIYAPRERVRLASLNAAHPQSTREAMKAIHPGLLKDDVIRQIGEPYAKRTNRRRIGPDRIIEQDMYRYTDGQNDFRLFFNDGVLFGMNQADPGTLDEDLLIFASIFQFYFLRLAVFFGCVGVFMNLIRGEMLDKSLHFYLLAPIPREWMLIGKYLAGLAATIVIFTASAALQIGVMLWQFDHQAVANYLQNSGWSQIGAYIGVTVLACIGYGSIFTAAGLFFRNPIVPAASVLIWESVNLFVPPTLKLFSLIFYLQSLCPLVAPMDSAMPAVLAALVSVAEPASMRTAVSVVGIMTIVILALAGRRSRRLEINYTAE
jgi:ABC-type transport system involved in multi-copper enzyme maturation permease subunit